MTEQEKTIADSLYTLMFTAVQPEGIRPYKRALRQQVDQVLRAIFEMEMELEECTSDVLRALWAVRGEYDPLWDPWRKTTIERLDEWPPWVRNIRRAVAAKLLTWKEPT